MKINVKPVEKQLQFREIVYNVLNKFINGQSSRKAVTQYRACEMAASCRYKMMQGNTIDWSMVFLFLVTRETMQQYRREIYLCGRKTSSLKN